MNCDNIRDKDHIANIYKKYEMNGIESIYKAINGCSNLEVAKHALHVIKDL
jgi:hypothetical protein